MMSDTSLASKCLQSLRVVLRISAWAELDSTTSLVAVMTCSLGYMLGICTDFSARQHPASRSVVQCCPGLKGMLLLTGHLRDRSSAQGDTSGDCSGT